MALHNNGFVHSVDINKDSIKQAQAEVEKQGLQNVVKIYHSDSLDFLENFSKKIDLLYLDSYDYSKSDIDIQKKSQEHHLEEFKRVENQLHEKSIVLIDDCDLPIGGKGRLAIAYKLGRDWKVVMES